MLCGACACTAHLAAWPFLPGPPHYSLICTLLTVVLSHTHPPTHPLPPRPSVLQDRSAAWRQWVQQYRLKLREEGMPAEERAALQVREAE